MTKPKFLFSAAAFFLFSSFALTNSFAQTETKRQAEPVYEIVLQTIAASNDANAKTNLPPSLSAVVRKLKTDYSFTNYHLTSTFIERVANTGNVELKSVSNETSQNQENYAPVFSEWSLVGLRALPNSKGQTSVQFQNFRFGQRVPIRTANVKDENGKTSSAINYEQVGLTLSTFGLSVNTPTVVGSVSSPNEQVMFFVLTVKPIDE